MDTPKLPHSSALMACVAVLATTVSAQHRSRCGCAAHNPARVQNDMPSDCGYSSTTPAARYDVSSIYRIPVVFHVITDSSGYGDVPTSQIRAQMEVLNEDFRAMAGTPGAPGYDTGIEFYLATVDPNGQPTTGITRTRNGRWFNDRGSYWNSLAWDTNRYLNIYTNSGGGALGYVPEIPQSGTLVGQAEDRVVVAWDTVGRNAPAGPPIHLGRTTTHEVGHYLGLVHTFDGGCSGGNCYTSGDLICDTNPEAQPHTGCSTGASSCGSLDPIHNYMDYSDDACLNQFTREQTLRMRCTLEHWRPQVWTRCELATVTNRNAGTNPQSYTATKMVLGETFTATIDVSSTGHSTGHLFGTLGSTNLPLFNGYTLLADLTAPSGNALPLPPASGPLARISFTVPVNYVLCGGTVYTQAAHYGGAAPGFALSNAQDCTIGLE